MGLLVLIVLVYVFLSWLYATYALKKNIVQVKDTYITEKEYVDHTNDDLSETFLSEENLSSKSQRILEKSYNAFNNIRSKAGMLELALNEKLEKSAQYHSDYLARYSTKLRYFSSHQELENTEGFRGKYAGDRAVHAGYQGIWMYLLVRG